jgi:hypothetical protein
VVGIRRKFVIKLWQLFCGEDKTVVWLSNDGSCFVVGIRQWIGYRMMEVVLWWGYDSNLAIEWWQLLCGGDTRVVWRSNYGSCFVVGIRR